MLAFFRWLKMGERYGPQRLKLNNHKSFTTYASTPAFNGMSNNMPTASIFALVWFIGLIFLAPTKLDIEYGAVRANSQHTHACDWKGRRRRESHKTRILPALCSARIGILISFFLCLCASTSKIATAAVVKFGPMIDFLVGKCGFSSLLPACQGVLAC